MTEQTPKDKCALAEWEIAVWVGALIVALIIVAVILGHNPRGG